MASEFAKFNVSIQKHFKEVLASQDNLFIVDVDKDELWKLYLNSFPAGSNPIFRERTEHDCNCCKQFIRAIGNVVAIIDNKVHTIWDVKIENQNYQAVADALNEYVMTKLIGGVYISNTNKIGADHTHQMNENGSITTWEHFFVNLPNKFVINDSMARNRKIAYYRDIRNVFKRSLDEISDDAIDTVLELISSNTLYKGAEWKNALNSLKTYKREYSLLSDSEKEIYAWKVSGVAGPVIGKIRNHSIGVLLTDISNGVDLDSAVRRYENIVAPVNYKRPKAIFTKKMLEDAKKTIEELGYMNSLSRRYAVLDDITVNNILFSNRDATKRIAGAASVFDEMMGEVKVNPKKFSKVEEIPIEKFISDVLPGAREVEAYVENKHSGNFVSLIAPQNRDAKSMFKWGNAFSWAYAGNLTDSTMKERVKAAGGKVDGDLRFSIQWNEDGHDDCDLDAHCIEPNGHEIFFKTDKKPRRSSLGGQLDVDVISPGGNIAVENITWPNRNLMRTGNYEFFVHQYSGSARNGFRAEIEFDGKVYSFDYHNSMRSKQDVLVATVTLSPNGEFSIKENLPSNMASKDIWGVKTNQFTPVTVMMYSPNYWDYQSGIGHKHYFFMLNGCVNPESPNGFYNEFLKPELETHKRVFEALGGKMAVENVDDQLSGIGFSSTKRAELIVKVKGATERMMKIKF